MPAREAVQNIALPKKLANNLQGLRNLPLQFLAAFGADALDEVFDVVHLVAVGAGDDGDVSAMEAGGFLADFAVEVAMVVLDVAMVSTVAEAVFGGAAAIFNGVDDVVFGKEGEGAKNGGAVEGLEGVLNVGEREGVVEFFNGTVDHYSKGRRPDIMLRKHVRIFF